MTGSAKQINYVAQFPRCLKYLRNKTNLELSKLYTFASKVLIASYKSTCSNMYLFFIRRMFTHR